MKNEQKHTVIRIELTREQIETIFPLLRAAEIEQASGLGKCAVFGQIQMTNGGQVVIDAGFIEHDFSTRVKDILSESRTHLPR